MLVENIHCFSFKSSKMDAEFEAVSNKDCRKSANTRMRNAIARPIRRYMPDIAAESLRHSLCSRVAQIFSEYTG